MPLQISIKENLDEIEAYDVMVGVAGYGGRPRNHFLYITQ